MKLTEIEKHISKVILKEAAKKTVRELDENPPGIFVAFVDDGNESYDVQIETNADGEITKHNCDCPVKNKLCVHKVAVVLKITNTKNPKTKTTAKSKKINATELLLQKVDGEELKKWVLQLISNNKEIDLEFQHRFTETKTHYTQTEIEKLTLDAVKAVIKNRKHPDVSELKKIVQLWQTIHQPIIDIYINNITNHENSNYIISIVETCIKIQDSFRTSSTGISTYIRVLLGKVYDAILSIENNELWAQVISKYLKCIWDKDNRMIVPYHNFAISFLEGNNPQRDLVILHHIFDSAKELLINNVAFENTSNKSLLDLAIKHNLFGKYYFLFTPIIYDNEYNIKLVKHLLEIKQYKIASKYCHKIISYNSQEIYNVPYLNFLRQIYSDTNEEIKKHEIIKKLLPLTFNFEDYVYLSNKMEDGEDKKKWRSNLLSKAKRESSYSEMSFACQEFCIQLMIAEGKTHRLFDYLNRNASFSLVIKYFDYFKSVDANLFIKQICNIEDTEFGFFGQQNQTKIDRETLSDLIIKAYPKPLLMAINNGRNMFSSRSVLVDIIQRKLIDVD